MTTEPELSAEEVVRLGQEALRINREEWEKEVKPDELDLSELRPFRTGPPKRLRTCGGCTIHGFINFPDRTTVTNPDGTTITGNATTLLMSDWIGEHPLPTPTVVPDVFVTIPSTLNEENEDGETEIPSAT